MLETSRRVIAILLSLSVGWSTLGGAVACVGMSSGGPSAGPSAALATVSEPMPAMAGMPDMADRRTESDAGRSADGHPDGQAPCCGADEPDPRDASGESVADCVLMTVCTVAMLPASAGPSVAASGIATAVVSPDDVAPPALDSPPDAPPPRG